MKLPTSCSAVNADTTENASRLPAFFLMATVIRRPKTGDEIFFLPVCAVCDKPIINFADANVVVFNADGEDEDYSPLEPLADLGRGEELLKIPGVPVAVHKECDRDHWKPWKPLRTVLKMDQSYDWKKPRGIKGAT